MTDPAVEAALEAIDAGMSCNKCDAPEMGCLCDGCRTANATEVAEAVLRAADDAEPEGPWVVEHFKAQSAHPMFHGDTGSPETWGLRGPGEMVQLFRDHRTARAVCNALNRVAAREAP